jgi:ABC-type transport system involved in multi-copper enzyme maturation permease subunit
MFWRILANEQFKVFKRTVLWVSVGLLTALLAVQFVSNYATAASGTMGESSMLAPERLAQLRQVALRSVTWPGAPDTALQYVEQIGWLAIIVVTGAVVAQEYAWRTLHLTLSHGIARVTFVLGKYAALFLPALLVVLIPLAVTTPLTLFFSAQLGGGLSLGQMQWGRLALATLCTFYGLLPYVAMTFFLAIVTRSVIAPIGGGIAYAIVELVLSLSGSSLATYLPRGLVTSLSAAVTGASASAGTGMLPVPVMTNPSVAAVGIAFYCVAFIGLSILVIQRQDLAG